MSWIWDVDFEALAARLDRLIASGERAAELALRFSYGGLDEARIEIVPELDAALDRGLELTEPGGELVFLATYTAMLGLQRVIADRGYARPYWERGVRVVLAHLYPDYLNIYADRGNLAVLTAVRSATASISTCTRSAWGRAPPTPTSSTSAAARTVSRRSSRRIWPGAGRAVRGRDGRRCRPRRVRRLPAAGQVLPRPLGSQQPGAGIFPLHTVAGDRRLIGDVLIECELDPGRRETVVGFENHAGRTILEQAQRRSAGSWPASGTTGCPASKAPARQRHRHVSPRPVAAAEPGSRTGCSRGQCSIASASCRCSSR